jgi:hypothetical protein
MKYDSTIATNLLFGRSGSSVTSRIANSKMLSWALILIGSIGIMWTLVDWYVEGDHLFGRPPFFVSLGASSIILGSFVRTKWQNFGIWTSSALIGQAAMLQMIDAGRRVHFQHYRQVSEMFTADPLPLMLFVLYSTAMASAAIYQRKSILDDLKKTFAPFRAVLLFGFLLLASTAVTPDLRVYITSLAIGGVVTLTGLINVYFVANSISQDSAVGLQNLLNKYLGGADEPAEILQLDRFVLAISTAVLLLVGSLSYFVYQSHPHIPDETQYLFQAKYMAAGQLTVSPPAVPEAFSMYMVPYLDNRWYGIFPPAFPAVLAFGVLMGVVWLVNPLLSSICILLAYLFFLSMYSRPFARVGVVLLAGSPWFIFMGMSLMSHMLTLTCSLAAALLTSRSIKSRRLVLSLFAGVFVGITSLVRPLDGAILATLLGIWTLLASREFKSGIVNCVSMFTGTILIGSIALPYNKAVTGSWMSLPLTYYYDKYFWPGANSIGFGPNHGLGWGLDAYPGHSPFEGLINSAINTFQVNTELFGWTLGSLAFATYFVISGRLTRRDAWAIVSIAVVASSYFFYWYHGGPDLGARYWFIAIVPLVALTVRGLQIVSSRSCRTGQTNLLVGLRAFAAVAAMCLITFVSYIPWRAADKYYHYLGMQPGIEQLAKDHSFGRSLILIKGSEHPDYQSTWISNPLNFEGDVPLYAWDKNEDVRAQLLNAYPDRDIWIIDGPSVTGNGYKIEAGPMTSEQLLRTQGRRN